MPLKGVFSVFVNIKTFCDICAICGKYNKKKANTNIYYRFKRKAKKYNKF